MDGATGGGRGAPPGPGGRGTGNTDETFKLIAQFKSLLHFSNIFFFPDTYFDEFIRRQRSRAAGCHEEE